MNAWLLLGVFILAWAVWQAWHGRVSLSWPTAPGSIESIAVVRSASSRGSRRRIDLKYAFAVAGTTYHGTRLRYGFLGSVFSQPLDDILRTYPEGSSVTVHYHPTNPSRSVLVPGTDNTSLAINLAVAVAVIAFGLIRAI